MFGFNKVPRLLGKYASANENERRDIRDELAKSPKSSAENALQCLTSGSIGIDHTCEIIGSFRNQEMFDFLVEVAKSPNSMHQHVAFRVIREQWKSVAASAMIECLDSNDFEVRKKAAEFLIDHADQKIQIQRIAPLLKSTERDKVRKAIEVLQAIGTPEATRTLGKGLVEPSDWTRKRILKAIKELNTNDSVGLISKLLSTETDNDVIKAALETLQVVGGPTEAREIVQMITLEDMTIRQLAAEVICAVGDSTVVPDVVALMRSRDVETRRLASYILYSVKDPRTGKVLIAALRDADWWVREIAVEALAKIEIGDMKNVLLGLLADPDPYIRRIAAEYYCHVVNPEAFGGLVKLLEDEDWWTRERSIMALGKARDPRALDPVVKLLGDKDVRLSIPDTIAQIGTPQAKQILLELLNSKDRALRYTLIHIAVQIGDPEGKKMLLHLIKDEDPKIAEEAQRVMTELLVKGSVSPPPE
jgi:serine/threonine-protein kinase